MAAGDPIDVTLKRLARLEQGQPEANRRLEQIVSRLDRLIEVTLRIRTDDTERMSGIEGRLRVLEERNPLEPG